MEMETMRGQTTIERVADALTDRLRDYGASVRLVDGERAGDWIEIDIGPWHWSTSDHSGCWGITTFYDRRPVAVPGTFQHTTDDGREVWWYANREDGPSTVDVDEIVEYVLGAM